VETGRTYSVYRSHNDFQSSISETLASSVKLFFRKVYTIFPRRFAVWSMFRKKEKSIYARFVEMSLWLRSLAAANLSAAASP
jgi:hypothetical protein